MARSEARMQFGIWEGLEDASANARLLYCVLLTEPTLNHCGVGRLCVPLWAANARLSAEDAETALAELCEGMWVLTDESTYEVLVRTLIRNDKVAEQPYVLKGALKESLLTRSRRLRLALAAELRRLPPRQPDSVSKSGKPVTYPDPHETADILDPPRDPKPSRNPSERVLESAVDPSESLHGGGGGSGGGTSPSPQHQSSRSAQRGTRIPDDFARTGITAEMVAWVRAEFPWVDARAQTDAFVDYWRAKAGKDASKLDWPATWRNWMRKAAENTPRGATPRHLAPVQASLPSDPGEAFADLRSRADAKAASQLLGVAYIATPQPPTDDTPPELWLRREALRFIDDNRPALLKKLAERRTAG